MREPLWLVAGRKQEVGLWMLERLPGLTELPGGYECVGVARGDHLVGGCLYTNYQPCKDGGNIQIYAVGHDWLSRRIVRELLGYPFRERPNGLGCHRVTVTIARGNKASRRLVEALGFKIEGKLERGYDTRQDAMIYGMRKERCRWI